jgi:hypothetical protein
MATAIFAHGLTNLASAVTPAIGGGSENADFPRANLGDLNPANPFKFTTDTGALVYDFTSPQAVQLVALIHHNLSAGLNVRWQGNATDSWGAPSLDQAFAIGAASVDNYRPNAWLDLSALSHTFRFWRLVVVDPNAAAIVLGDLWFSTPKRSFVHNYSVPYDLADVRPARRALVTRGGVRFTYPGAGRQRALDSQVMTSEAGLEALRDWHRSTNGGDRPSLFIPDPDASVRDAWLGTWTLGDWRARIDHAAAGATNGAQALSFIEAAPGGSW